MSTRESASSVAHSRVEATADALRPTRLEIASGLVIGELEGASALPEVARNLDPLTALEQALVPALEREPCLVAFSGGRDSSALLAVATRVARREGLPLPVPATYCFPDHPEADEGLWQERVLRWLKLPEWHRRTIRDELGLLAPIGQRTLLRHGLLWPANAFSTVPLMEDAGGGALVSGVDGDGLFDAWPWSGLADVLARRRGPRPADVREVAKAVAPQALRAVWYGRFRPPRVPWLRPHVERSIARAQGEEFGGVPLRWDRRVEWVSRRRYLALVTSAMRLLASDSETEMFFPFLDRRFLAALAQSGGAAGLGDRTAIMRVLFTGLLPHEVLTREDKGDGTRWQWGAEARSFAEHWDGRGVPDDLVDPEALREALAFRMPPWNEPIPRFQAWLSVQAAWFATRDVR